MHEKGRRIWKFGRSRKDSNDVRARLFLLILDFLSGDRGYFYYSICQQPFEWLVGSFHPQQQQQQQQLKPNWSTFYSISKSSMMCASVCLCVCVWEVPLLLLHVSPGLFRLLFQIAAAPCYSCLRMDMTLVRTTAACRPQLLAPYLVRTTYSYF